MDFSIWITRVRIEKEWSPTPLLSCESKNGGGTRNPAPMGATSRPPACSCCTMRPTPMRRVAPSPAALLGAKPSSGARVESRKCFAFHGTKQRVGGGPMTGLRRCAEHSASQ